MATTYKRPVFGKKSDVPTVQVATTLTEDLLKKLDGYCVKEGRPSSAVIRGLVTMSVPEILAAPFPKNLSGLTRR